MHAFFFASFARSGGLHQYARALIMSKGDKQVDAAAASLADVKLSAGGGDNDSGPSAEEVERNFGLVRSVGEECQSEAELRKLLTKKQESFVCTMALSHQVGCISRRASLKPKT